LHEQIRIEKISNIECPISNDEGNFGVGHSKFGVRYLLYSSYYHPIVLS
jgi:hypothetical protein